MRERLAGPRLVLFAVGSAGYQFAERIVVNIAVYFYLPPAGRGLEPQVSQELFLGGLTAFGLAMLVGRLFDMLADPVVAQATDSSRSRFGRRRLYMLIAAVPMSLVPVLLFWPPGAPGSEANFWWLSVVLDAYNVFFTIYVVPYLALIPELAEGLEERVNLTTLMALVSFPVLGLYSVGWTWAYEGARTAGFTPTDAIRVVVVVSAILAAAFSLLPVWAVDETRHARSIRSDLPVLEALGATIRNPPFLIYLVGQIFFVIGITLINSSLVYYATVVLGRSEGFAGSLGAILFVSTAVSFLVVNPVSRRVGPKWTLIGCVLLFSAALFALGLLEVAAAGTPEDARNLAIIVAVMLVCGVSVAGFLVLPHVMISQLIDRDTARTGAHRGAMFFGVQGLFTKLMYGVAGAILAFLFARFGNSSEEPLGVLLIGPVAGGFCLVSVLCFALYPERRVVSEGGRPVVSEAGRGDGTEEQAGAPGPEHAGRAG